MRVLAISYHCYFCVLMLLLLWHVCVSSNTGTGAVQLLLRQFAWPSTTLVYQPTDAPASP